MKKSKKKIFFVCISNFVLVFILLAVILLVPTVSVTIKTYYNALSTKFIGKKAEYQGVIYLWNVDTFEGGSASKSSFLMKTAVSFEKIYKGALIKVDNLTTTEMFAKLKNGEKPHMISFGCGIGSHFSEEMLSFDDKLIKNHMENVASAGFENQNIKAIAWAMSGYSLITTTEKLEKASVDLKSDHKLLALSSSYDKKVGKKTKHTYSLTFGGNDYSSAMNLFSRAFNQSSEELKEKQVLDCEYSEQTSYQAYCSFIENKSSYLLGTGRDLYRMQNRLNAGKLQDFIYEPFNEYTDLVQFISVIKSEKNIEKVCRQFIEYLVSEKVQETLTSIGMISPLKNVDIYQNTFLDKLENTIDENTLIKSAF